MLIFRLWLRSLRFLGLTLVLLTLLPWACTRKTVSFNSTPEPPLAAVVADTLTHTADSLKGKPSLSTARKVVLTKEEAKAAKDKEKDAQRKSKKKKKKLFLGERTKKAFVKSGPKGRNQIIEIFYYLRYFQQPNPYAPARYYYNPKKHKIFKATGEIEPDMKILHGPYKKMQNNKILETGYYALGTKHLRWERVDKNNILLSKTHYEMGFPRDANISYYGNDRSLINEVIPYVNGKLEGDYAKFTIEGQREWTGQFENGHKVGEWTNYWGFRNRKRYIYQYPESGYDPEVEEPELVKEYNRNAILIYDKETGLDKRGMTEAEQAPKGRAVPKAPAKVQPKRAKG
jgi:antitoxin component YwqK of YwqJK toxin-antitoxin module